MVGPGTGGMAGRDHRDRLPTAVGVRPCDAVRRSADADPVPGYSVLLPAFGSTLVLGDPVRMVRRRGRRADLARRTDRAWHRRYRPAAGGDDHPDLRGPVALGRSRPQAAPPLLDLGPVFPLARQDDHHSLPVPYSLPSPFPHI